MGFTIALSNVLITLFYIFPGFVITKMKKATTDHLPTLSAVLIYIGTPFMEISSFMSLEYSAKGFANMAIFFGLTLVLQILFILVFVAIFHKKFSDSKYRMLTIASMMGNVGFFGIPIVATLFPSNPEVTAYATIFAVSMNILVFTVGIYCLTGDKRYISLKSAFCNPNVFGLVLALPFYFFGLKAFLPTVLTDAIKLIGSLTTPLCMFILGIRLASTPLKRIFARPIVYVAAAMKLIVFPLFCYALVYFLPIDPTIKASVLILAATPCAAVILSLAEIHRSNAEIAANCILITTLFCFLTIPMLTLLL